MVLFQHKRPLWLGRGNICLKGVDPASYYARVAQLVEQRTENPRVGGSSPPPGTTSFKESNVLSQHHTSM